MIEIVDKSQCTGCTACKQVCSHNAICMHFDEEGHVYPLADATKCVDCGLCEKVCPMLHKERIPSDESLDTLPVFAVYNKDEAVREKSTSGGVFSLMAQYVIYHGGVVYAARFDKDFHIMHSRFDNIKEIDAYRGSKYAQSNLGDTFRQIRQDLKTMKVLFVGTPCQVAGLKGFLIKDYENLYTCDFICMGISSSKIWEEYLKEYWGDHTINRIFFKDKRNGWHNWKMLIQYDERQEYLSNGMADPFFYGYLTHLTYRPSCLSCPFRTCHRVSDITLADCWGIEKVNPQFDDNKGCTTIILQNDKARSLFKTLENSLNISNYKISDVINHNPYIVKPIKPHPQRERFYRLYQTKGFRAAYTKYNYKRDRSIVYRIINKINRILKNDNKSR